VSHFYPFYVERLNARRFAVREWITEGYAELVMLTASESRAEAEADKLNANFQAEMRGYRRAKLEEIRL